jgi:hypothetical protein
VTRNDVAAATAATREPLSGPDQNERLNAWGGAVLLGMLAAEGVTVLMLWLGMRDRGLGLHVLIGFALLLPVAQKLASTTYRFTRYYTGDPAYRASGPPQIVLRVLAPVMILLTVEVLATGVLLEYVHGSLHRPLEELHKLGFFAWFAVTAIHVVYYVWRVPRLVLDDVVADVRPTSPDRSGALARTGVTVASIVLGCALSIVLCNSLGIVTLW